MDTLLSPLLDSPLDPFALSTPRALLGWLPEPSGLEGLPLAEGTAPRPGTGREEGRRRRESSLSPRSNGVTRAGTIVCSVTRPTSSLLAGGCCQSPGAHEADEIDRLKGLSNWRFCTSLLLQPPALQAEGHFFLIFCSLQSYPSS